MTSGYLDTNILLRVLLDDVPQQSEAVAAWFASITPDDRPRIAASTASEVVSVVAGPRLSRDRAHVAELIRVMLDLPAAFDDREVLLRALDLFSDVHPDWDDCLVAAYALDRAGGTVHSFDQGLDRIPGITRIEPGA